MIVSGLMVGKLKKKHPVRRDAEQQQQLRTKMLGLAQEYPTFIDDVISGDATAGEIDAYVQRWHENEAPAWGQLWDWLGMTLDQYSTWMKDPQILDQLIEERREVRERYGFVRLCDNCHRRPGTSPWGDLTRGLLQYWCPDCVISTQLEHAREQAARIPDLEHRLTEIRASEQS